MRTFLALCTAIFFFCSCNNAEKELAAANTALIEKYVDAVQAGDYPTIDSMLADNYMGYGPSVDDSINRTDGLASWKDNLVNLYEKIEYTRSKVFAVTIADGPNAGEWVANWALLTIKYKDGRGPVHVYANTNYKIENGKIVRTYTIYNELDVMEQLGMR